MRNAISSAGKRVLTLAVFLAACRDPALPPRPPPTVAPVVSAGPAPVPAPVVEDPNDAIRVGRGRDFACALTRKGTVSCWGESDSSRDVVRYRARPTTIREVSGAVALAVAERAACAVTSDGSVSCWQGSDGNRLEKVARLGEAREVAMNTYLRCAVLRDGTVACWGMGTVGGPPATRTHRR